MLVPGSNVDKRHVCHICSKNFQRKNDVQRHIRSVHSKEKPYKCDICDTRFTRPDGLKMHLESVSHKKKVMIQSVP
jgi:zinc finger protein MSN2/4